MIYLPHLCLATCLSLLASYYHSFPLLLAVLIILGFLMVKNKPMTLFSVIIVLLVNLHFHYKLTPPVITNHTFKITKVNNYDYNACNKQACIILKTTKKLNKDDVVLVAGNYQPLSYLVNNTLFDMNTYLRSKNIHYSLEDNKLKVLSKITKIKEATNIIDHYFDYFFLMDKTNMDQDVIDNLIELAIIHLVVVSGFHFNKLNMILEKIFFMIKNEKISKALKYAIMFSYLNCLAFTIPALRAFLMIIFKQEKLNRYLSNIHKQALIALAIIIIKPLVILSLSFQLTFIISTFIMLIPEKYKKNIFLFNLIIFMGTIPLIANINYYISPLSIITQVLILPFLYLFYFVIFIAHYCEFFIPLGLTMIDLFKQLISCLSFINIKINLGYLSLSIALAYYSLYLLFLYKEKYVYLLAPIGFITAYFLLPNPIGFVTFLNIGQGDCIVIKPPLTNEAMMIDVGKPYKTKTVENIIYPYLYANRIKSIKYLVITHDDSDHSGGENDLKKLIKVVKTIKYKQSSLKFNNLTFIDLLAKEKFSDKNANSITLYTRINGLNYMFTGDINAKTELFLDKYVEELPVDILKVAHHGSKTSTSATFLRLTNPKISIISAKKNNSYHHPHPEVVRRLQDFHSQIYSTLNHGNISIYYFLNINYLKAYQ